MRFKYTTVVRCDICPCPILVKKTNYPMNHMNGATLHINGEDYVVVNHESTSTLGESTNSIYIYVVLAKWYRAIDDPQNRDDETIGYYYYSDETDYRHSKSGINGCPSDYYLQVHNYKCPVQRKSRIDLQQSN